MASSISHSLLEQAYRLLETGDVIAFPTETVYGLGANAYNQCAVEKIFAIKGRPSYNPLIAHISSLEKLSLVTSPSSITELSPFFSRLSQFMPGPLSVVIPKNTQICSAVSAGLTTVAVRIPSHPIAQELLRRCPFPLAAPSANPSNYISPTSAKHVSAQLGNQISLVLDGGECAVGIESTILDLTGATPRILRHGVVTAEMLADALEVTTASLLIQQSGEPISTPVAPGMLKEHYSPTTPLKLIPSNFSGQLSENSGLITMHRYSPLIASHSLRHSASLSDNGDFNEICYNLFKTLREFDSLGLASIYIESCERSGIGRAIMDRIDRASAKWATL